LLSGVLTQLLKHIVGRPRPNTITPATEYNLNFFTTDSHFHSFPSGHTSTIFAVILVLSLMIPKLKYFFYFIAIIISLSRVVVGAHFLTDIICGGAVAFIGFKFSKLILNRFFKIKNNEYPLFFKDNFVVILIFMSTISIILAVAPAFDIFFSNIFYFGENQFLMQSYYATTIFFRKIVLGFILIYILIIPLVSILFPLHQLYFGYHFKKQTIIYIWFSLIFVLLIIINLLLKNMWGRVRPNEILELGGKDYFTPWYQISNQCLSNCSFVSGDAAVGFSLVVFYFIVKKEAYLWLSVFLGSIVGLIRIMEGGHYLSDVIFSGLIVFLVNIIFYSYYLKKFNG
jgi:lipid A 4'-phosphatase